MLLCPVRCLGRPPGGAHFLCRGHYRAMTLRRYALCRYHPLRRYATTALYTATPLPHSTPLCHYHTLRHYATTALFAAMPLLRYLTMSLCHFFSQQTPAMDAPVGVGRARGSEKLGWAGAGPRMRSSRLHRQVPLSGPVPVASRHRSLVPSAPLPPPPRAGPYHGACAPTHPPHVRRPPVAG